MRALFLAALLASTVGIQSGSAQAQECLNFASGEILCDDGYYAYYWSPAIGQWQVLDRAATAAALGVGQGDGSLESSDSSGSGSVVYGGDGSLTTTEDGCTMFSSPGYGYGESLSFSSGC